ncbi:MAG: helix-turn-helix domain-containing protein [Acidimicrobiales bacterium]
MLLRVFSRMAAGRLVEFPASNALSHPMNKKQQDPGAVDMKTGGCAPLLAVTEVAQLLNVRPRHIYRLVSERRIPYIKLGKLLRFEPAAITEWIQSGRHNALL